MLQAIGDFRHQFVDELRDFLEVLPRIDANLLDPRIDQVAQGAQGQGQVLVDQRRRADGLDLRGDLVPQAAQVADVGKNLVFPGALGGGAQDEAALLDDAFRLDAVGDHPLQAITLDFVLDLQGNADMAGARHINEIARRNRQLGGQTRALGADGVLGDLHHQALPLVHQRADAFHRATLAGGNLRRMDERRTFQADIDEGRLHAGQHANHLAFVDIPDDATALRALDMDFLQDAVFHHRHA
ncbi:hypothetical protein D9M71_428550 [compost metagenome]